MVSSVTLPELNPCLYKASIINSYELRAVICSSSGYPSLALRNCFRMADLLVEDTSLDDNGFSETDWDFCFFIGG